MNMDFNLLWAGDPINTKTTNKKTKMKDPT